MIYNFQDHIDQFDYAFSVNTDATGCRFYNHVDSTEQQLLESVHILGIEPKVQTHQPQHNQNQSNANNMSMALVPMLFANINPFFFFYLDFPP